MFDVTEKTSMGFPGHIRRHRIHPLRLTNSLNVGSATSPSRPMAVDTVKTSQKAAHSGSILRGSGNGVLGIENQVA